MVRVLHHSISAFYANNKVAVAKQFVQRSSRFPVSGGACPTVIIVLGFVWPYAQRQIMDRRSRGFGGGSDGQNGGKHGCDIEYFWLDGLINMVMKQESQYGFYQGRPMQDFVTLSRESTCNRAPA
jgi:hypothetical protein